MLSKKILCALLILWTSAIVFPIPNTDLCFAKSRSEKNKMREKKAKEAANDKSKSKEAANDKSKSKETDKKDNQSILPPKVTRYQLTDEEIKVLLKGAQLRADEKRYDGWDAQIEKDKNAS